MQTQILGYADDIDIISRSQAAVEEEFLAPEREANGNERTIRIVGQSVTLGDRPF
jgi:hypothetical protein